jgi:hypothetical protein
MNDLISSSVSESVRLYMCVRVCVCACACVSTTTVLCYWFFKERHKYYVCVLMHIQCSCTKSLYLFKAQWLLRILVLRVVIHLLSASGSRHPRECTCFFFHLTESGYCSYHLHNSTCSSNTPYGLFKNFKNKRILFSKKSYLLNYVI